MSTADLDKAWGVTVGGTTHFFEVKDEADAFAKENGSKAAWQKYPFKAVWGAKCEGCGESPIVRGTGMCGPCTFGEADTAGGNW